MLAAIPPEGKLEEHPFPAVLQALHEGRRDGCLTVSRGAITRRLYLRGGMIIYGSSSERQDRLGEILIAQGKLTKADHKKYWEQSKAGNRLLGITLLVNDRITPSDLYQGVTAQVVTILERLQKWHKGDYKFEEGCEPAAGTVLLRIPLALYLRAGSGKRSAAKQSAAGAAPTRAAAKKKSAVAAPPPAAPEPAAVPAAGEPSPSGAAVAEEQVLEIHEELPEAEPMSPAAVQEMQCVGEVSFMVQELRKRLNQDPFALLGVPANAQPAIIQTAYQRIAKILHPDRLPKGCMPELVQEAGEIYREVTAAVQAAEERFRRATVAASGAAAADQRAQPLLSEEEQARRFFAKGRDWIAKRNYWQAVDALRQSVRLKPAEAVYRQYLGLALMQTKRLQEAEEHLLEAARLEPNNPAHLLNLGRAYRSGRLIKKAREAFERALRLDPRDQHARDELNDLPEELPPSRRAESGGLLKKLFGKG